MARRLNCLHGWRNWNGWSSYLLLVETWPRSSRLRHIGRQLDAGRWTTYCYSRSATNSASLVSRSRKRGLVSPSAWCRIFSAATHMVRLGAFCPQTYFSTYKRRLATTRVFAPCKCERTRNLLCNPHCPCGVHTACRPSVRSIMDFVVRCLRSFLPGIASAIYAVATTTAVEPCKNSEC